MGVFREWQRLHHIGKSLWQQVGEVIARWPVFQLQDSRTTIAVTETGSDALESQPKLPHGILTKNRAAATVDQVGAEFAELCQEGVRMPEGWVEAVVTAADDDGGPATPLAAPQQLRRRTF